MNVLELYRKVIELKTALANGDWLVALTIALDIANAFVARDGNRAVAEEAGGDLTEDQVKEFKTAVKEIKAAAKKPPRGTKSAVGGPAAIILLPLLVQGLTKLLEAWLKNR